MSTQPNPTVPAAKSLRVLIAAAATAAWYDAESHERERVLARLQEVCRAWCSRDGTRFLGSVDDDLFLVGDPRGFGRWSIFLIFEIDRFDDVAAMIDDARHGPVRLTSTSR